MSNEVQQSHTVKDAFAKTTQNLASVSSVLLIVGILRNVKEAFEFITENLVASSAALLLLGLLFVYNLISASKHKRKVSSAEECMHGGAARPASEQNGEPEKVSWCKGRWTPIILVTSILALVVVMGILAVLTFSGVHYVMLASYPEPQVSQYAELMNNRLEQLGAHGVEIKVGRSSPPNPAHALMLGGPYFSQVSARESYAAASHYLESELIRRYVDDDPQLVSYYLFRRGAFTSLNR